MALNVFGGRGPFGELSLLEAKASKKSSHSSWLSDAERGAQRSGEQGMGDVGSNAGREICLAMGLGRSLLAEAVFFGFASCDGPGLKGGEREEAGTEGE